jgi:hypothetical protein
LDDAVGTEINVRSATAEIIESGTRTADTSDA